MKTFCGKSPIYLHGTVFPSSQNHVFEERILLCLVSLVGCDLFPLNFANFVYFFSFLFVCACLLLVGWFGVVFCGFFLLFGWFWFSVGGGVFFNNYCYFLCLLAGLSKGKQTLHLVSLSSTLDHFSLSGNPHAWNLITDISVAGRVIGPKRALWIQDREEMYDCIAWSCCLGTLHLMVWFSSICHLLGQEPQTALRTLHCILCCLTCLLPNPFSAL